MMRLLHSLRDRAAARLAALRFNPSRWDWAEIWLIIGFGALAAYIMQGHGAPDPLPIAVGACLMALSRMKDRLDQ